MKRTIKQTWWTHFPAVAVFLAFGVYLVRALPLPARAAVHFNTDGIPNGYGSPLMALGIIFGLSLMYITISCITDDVWVSQERKKTFNWLAIMDEALVGFLCGVGIGYLRYLESGDATFTFPWAWVLVLGGGGLLLALLLEVKRPFCADNISRSSNGGETRLEAELARQIQSRTAFVFWDSQNPALVTVGSILLPLIMFASAALVFSSIPWVAALLAVNGLLLFLPYGGMRVMVTRREIVIRFGLFGFRLLKLDMAQIAGIEAMEFSPLKDFGGYGIRFNKEMSAYYLRGNRGVKLTMSNGKKYLVGSDDAGVLAGVIQALART